MSMDQAVSRSQIILERALERIDEGNHRAALAELRSANENDPAHAQVRSYYGLCLGLVERRYNEAVDLCQSAVKQEFFNPDLYLNVARLNLAFGFKSEGLRYLRRGSMIDPANEGIADLLEQLGYRSDPVLAFLPRRHVLNRWLGLARHMLRPRSRSLGPRRQPVG